ncbi:MAG: GTPase domain-containing protein [Methylococcaceae bacterium]
MYNLPLSMNPGLRYKAMLDLICLLKSRHESVLSSTRTGDEARQRLLAENLQSLAFAEAFLERLTLQYAEKNAHPLQVAIIGPTQAGKSTIINQLLQDCVAEPSPLAGYTIHPQGFYADLQPERTAWADAYFKAYRRMNRDDLPRDRYDCWSLDPVRVTHDNPLRERMLWDTPDFDSVDAAAYQSAVLRVAALADVVVLVLSKDKYADLAVWKLLKLLEPLAQPTVVCLNKLEPASRTTITESLRRKWQDTRSDALPAIIPVPYIENLHGGEVTVLEHERGLLWAALKQAMGQVQRKRQTERASVLVGLHRDNWLAPVRAEHLWAKEWRVLVEESREDALGYYRSGYLDHPQHYETFRQALREVLRLLEVPGLSAALTGTREVVTWIPRQILRLGQGESSANRTAGPGSEAHVLLLAFQHQLTRLQDKLLQKRDDDSLDQNGWRELGRLLTHERPALTQAFEAGIRRYIEDFQGEINRTAEALFEALEQDPVLLNGLRAVRVGTDAGALALALYTAGLGWQDLVIAPAMLSLTTLLTETALGYHLEKAASQLRKRQVEAVDRLFQHTVGEPLSRFPSLLDHSRYFNIPPDTLNAMEQHFS